MSKYDNIMEKVFLFALNTSYLLYFLVMLGIGNFAPQYLETVKTFLKVFVGSVLFIRYNPITYKEKKFSEFDRRLVFSSSIFLLLSTALVGSVESVLKNKTSVLLDKTKGFTENFKKV